MENTLHVSILLYSENKHFIVCTLGNVQILGKLRKKAALIEFS